MRSISQLITYGLSTIHMIFLKLFYPKAFFASFMQDISCSTKIVPQGCIRLGKRIHTKKNVVFEAAGSAGLEIGDDCFFNNNCMVVAKEKITIGKSCSCGPNVLIYDHDHKIDQGFIHEEYTSAPVIIGEHVWIGANTVILAGTVIGENSVVGAGSVLKGEYPPDSVIVQKRTTQCLNIDKNAERV